MVVYFYLNLNAFVSKFYAACNYETFGHKILDIGTFPYISKLLVFD